MNKSISVPAIAVLLALSAPVSAQKPSVPTIEQLAAYPKYSSFSLSPDGKYLAALQSDGEQRVIAVWKLDAMDKKPTLIGSEKMKFSGVSFIKNGLLAVSLWQPYDLRTDRVLKTFINKLMITDIEGKNWNEPLPQPRAMSRDAELAQSLSNPTILDSLPNDPDHVLLVNNVGNTAGDVYKVNIRNFRAERIQQSDDKVWEYVTDLDGNLRSRLKGNTDGKGAYVQTEFRNPDTGAWEEHFRSYSKNRDVNQVVGFAKDPNIAFLSSNAGSDKRAIYEYNIRERKRVDTLFEHKLFDASGVIVAHHTNSDKYKQGDILGVTYNGLREPDTQWTSPAMASLDAGIRKALGVTPSSIEAIDIASKKKMRFNYPEKVDVTLVDFTPDLSTVIAMTEGPASPPKFYLFQDGKLSPLAEAYPQIDPRSLGQTNFVYYKARDGLDIPAFLTKPNPELCGTGPWPTVIHPHGGPWARDTINFDGSMWVPLMVSRCMAVLQPQYRGSEGWGRKLWMAGDAEWGQKMQDDKDDGAKWLIDNKIAIPGRIAMFGFSYGGYAAFAASVRPNDLYKCAIAGAGVSDIKRIWARFYTNPFFREAQAPTVEGLSPADKAAQIKIPIMVYHGDRDRIVPLEQSEWFVNAAKNSNVPVEYHEIKDYAHGPAWTRKIMGDQLRFIETYLQKGCGQGGL
ncbi:MAG: S9 family peptidase [Pseudoxanthomonas suwonensis]|nr:MAG: S9 family peptidase [Pseudoxanthomonas suwonensis]